MWYIEPFNARHHALQLIGDPMEDRSAVLSGHEQRWHLDAARVGLAERRETGAQPGFEQADVIVHLLAHELRHARSRLAAQDGRGKNL